jgi:type I restriction-modification system DNA methylase subunit
MSLNESIVEDAAHEWFGVLGYSVAHGPQLAPGEYLPRQARWAGGGLSRQVIDVFTAAGLPKPDIYRKEEPRYSRRVEMDEIKKNDFHLNISRYISTAVGEEEISLEETHQKLVEVERTISSAREKHNQFLAELGVPPLPGAHNKRE